LSLRLKTSIQRLVGAVMTMALVALMLAVFPTVAEAQIKAQADARSTSSIVVRPGDSLWSISSERLGPNATPQQIANGVERIYTRNRNRIGADPNLILVGQELSLPSVGEPSRAKPSTKVTPERAAGARPAEREAIEPVAASPTARGGKIETERTATTTGGDEGTKARQAPAPVAKPVVAKPVALPDVPAKQVIPKVDSPSATEDPSPVEVFGRAARSLLYSAISVVVGLLPQDDHLLERRLLGLGIIVLTLLVAALMVWRLPMKRGTPWDDEVWGIGSGDYGPAANRIAPFAYHPGSLGGRGKEGAHSPEGTTEPQPIESEWNPSAELEDSLLKMPLQGRTLPPENLEAIRYQVEVALEELALLSQRRELFDTERHLEAALKDLYGHLSAMARAHG
jgi:hypothetical protein